DVTEVGGKAMKKKIALTAIMAIVAVATVVGIQAATAAPAEKITICHRAPNDTHYVVITTKALTPYGAVGHFDAGGNPEPGHEGDVFPDANGECPCLGDKNAGHN